VPHQIIQQAAINTTMNVVEGSRWSTSPANANISVTTAAPSPPRRQVRPLPEMTSSSGSSSSNDSCMMISTGKRSHSLGDKDLVYCDSKHHNDFDSSGDGNHNSSGDPNGNPSLHSLITRARRGVGVRGSCSAHTSPVNHRRQLIQVALHGGQPPEDLQQQPRGKTISQALDELQDCQVTWPGADVGIDEGEVGSETLKCEFQPDQKHPLRVYRQDRQASQVQQQQQQEEGGVPASPAWRQMMTASPGASVSSFASSTTIPAARLVVEDPEDKDDQEKKDYDYCYRRTLSLPDPSAVRDRRSFFSVSRRMCSRSSFESHRSRSNHRCRSNSVDCSDPEHEGVTTANGIAAYLDRAVTMVDEHTATSLLSLGHPPAARPEQVAFQIHHEHDEDDEDDELSTGMSLEDEHDDGYGSDDESILSDVDFDEDDEDFSQPMALHQDDDSIAFSVDSVRVRRKTYSPRAPRRADQYDFVMAVPNMDHVNANESSASVAPMQLDFSKHQ